MHFVKWIGLFIAAILVTAVAIYAAGRLDQSMKRRVPDPDASVPTLIVDLPPLKQDDVLIVCNEERFQPGFEKFRQFVQVAAPAVAVPGGPLLIAAGNVPLDSSLAAPKRALIEVLKRHSPRRVVLLAHEWCLYTDAIAAWENDAQHVRTRQYADLDRAQDVIRTWFPNATVEVWYGERYGTSQLRFRPVPPDSLSRSRAWYESNPRAGR